MRLIEKKCPNCGANLEFDEDDKSCVCTYCKRSFEIERDLNDLDKFNLIYDKIQKPVKIFFYIPFIMASFIILIIIISMIFGFRSTTKKIKEGKNIGETEEIVNEKNELIMDASELTNDNLDDIDRQCSSVLNQSIVGRSDTTYSYQRTGDPRLEKIYVVSDEDSNYIISIYNVKYHNFFNQADQQTVYVPVVFENVKKDTFILNKGKNPAPEYYLNEEKSSYIYAYGSLQEAYDGVVKQYEGEYDISEK